MDGNVSPQWLRQQAQLTLGRVLPHLAATFANIPAAEWQLFEARLRDNFEHLFGLLHHLYGGRYDFFYHLEQILETAARLYLARPADLKALDAARVGHDVVPVAADAGWRVLCRLVCGEPARTAGTSCLTSRSWASPTCT